MSDKRRRFRKPRDDKQQTITIARRNNDEASTSSQKTNGIEITPKILLKPKTSEKDEKLKDEDDTTITESNSRSEPSNVKISPSSVILCKEQEQEIVPKMTRPATILSSTFVVSSNLKRLLKDNNDFFVVGVIGSQGVGKSTILNLLAADEPNCDYYKKIFIDEDGYFPTRLKQNKNPSRSRTESTHMFITGDRMILLDAAPVLCNSYKKDMTTNELDDLRSIINFLSVCHLVIVVYKDFPNINFLRLLRLAELMKPSNSNNNATSTDYFPNLLFIKNRAKRIDFSMSAQKQMNDMLEAFFKDSKMRIYRGQTAEQLIRLKKSNRTTEFEFLVNSFVFPEVKGLDAMPYHKPLNEIIDDLRWLVFTTPRNELAAGSELTEFTWFELFEKVTQMQHFFFNSYDEIHRNHFDSGSTRDNQDTWKE